MRPRLKPNIHLSPVIASSVRPWHQRTSPLRPLRLSVDVAVPIEVLGTVALLSLHPRLDLPQLALARQ